MMDLLDDELENRKDFGNGGGPRQLSPDAIEALLLAISARVERLDSEAETTRDTLLRIERLCQELLVHVAREKKE